MSHTPGPWEPAGATIYAKEKDDFGRDRKIAVGVAYAAEFRELYDSEAYPRNVPSDESIHGAGVVTAWRNADLMAAAPDMLAALELAAEVLKPFTAKPIGAPGSIARGIQDDQIAAHKLMLAAIAKAKGETR